jgi:hypothetical protein
LTQRVARATEERWSCLFRGNAFSIEGMVEEKMVSTSFGGVADYEEQAPGASVTYARTLGAGAARLERTWRLGLGKSSIGYGSPNATWCWVSPSVRWRKGSTSVRFLLLIVIIILLLIIKILIFYTTTDNIFSIYTINYK